MKKKRRDSQGFNFTQTEEALEANEKLRQLYQNKNFVYPEVKGLETIVEEESEHIEEDVEKRSTDLDIGLNEGKSFRKRFIKNFKSWKQVNPERILKRELMVKKMWKGRLQPKRSCNFEEKLETLLSEVDKSLLSKGDEEDKDVSSDSSLMIKSKKKCSSRGKSLRDRLNMYVEQKKRLEADKKKKKKPVFQVCVGPRPVRVDHEKMKGPSRPSVERTKVARVRQKKL